MFKIGITVSHDFYSFQYYPTKIHAKLPNTIEELYIKLQLDMLTYHEEVFVLLEKLPLFLPHTSHISITHILITSTIFNKFS